MGHRIWNFELDGRSHKVELHSNIWTDKKTLKVEDKLMPESWNYSSTSNSMRVLHKWEYPLRIDNRSVKICITYPAYKDTELSGTNSYDLYVDNHLIKPEKTFLIFYDFDHLLTVMVIILAAIILIKSLISWV